MTAVATPRRTVPKLWVPSRSKRPEAGQTVRAAVYASARIAKPGERAPNGEQFDVHIVAATDHVARDHGIIEIGAWKRDISLYRRNPVVMWAHDYTKPPIATSVYDRIDENSGRLEQFWTFLDGITDDEHDRLASRVKALYAVGGMRCASVGWLTHEIREATLAEKSRAEQRGEPEVWWVVTRAELMEVSAVPVPSDPYATQVERAIRDAGKKGVDTKLLVRAWAEAKKRDLANISDEDEVDPSAPALDDHDEADISEYRCRKCGNTQREPPPCAECDSAEMIAVKADVTAEQVEQGGEEDLEYELTPGSGGTNVGIKGVKELAKRVFEKKRAPASQSIDADHASGVAVVGDSTGAPAGVGAAALPADSTDDANAPTAADFAGSVQRLIFSKEWWSGKFQVQYWAVIHGWKHINIEETAEGWVLVQRIEADFWPGTFVMTCLTGAPYEAPGDSKCKIKAVLGSVKVAPDDPDKDKATPINSPVEAHPGDAGLNSDGSAKGTKGAEAAAEKRVDDMSDEEALATVIEQANHDAEAAVSQLLAPSASRSEGSQEANTLSEDETLAALAELTESEPDTVRAAIHEVLAEMLKADFGVV